MRQKEKKKHPWARCIECYTFFPIEMANKKCSNCEGTVKSELRPNTWFECEVCENTGTTHKSNCNACNGTGWLFTEIFV